MLLICSCDVSSLFSFCFYYVCLLHQLFLISTAVRVFPAFSVASLHALLLLLLLPSCGMSYSGSSAERLFNERAWRQMASFLILLQSSPMREQEKRKEVLQKFFTMKRDPGSCVTSIIYEWSSEELETRGSEKMAAVSINRPFFVLHLISWYYYIMNNERTQCCCISVQRRKRQGVV